MKTITLALWLAASAYGVALASESRHAVIVDMPKVINLNHASPDTWHTLPPVPSKDVLAKAALWQLPSQRHSTVALAIIPDPVCGELTAALSSERLIAASPLVRP